VAVTDTGRRRFEAGLIHESREVWNVGQHQIRLRPGRPCGDRAPTSRSYLDQGPV